MRGTRHPIPGAAPRPAAAGGVTLINPPATYAGSIAQKCFPPTALLSLGASLRRAGIPVEVVDANALGLGDAALVARVAAGRPALVGLPVFAETLPAARRTLEALRRALPDATLVVGGPQATAWPRATLVHLPAADCLLAGEAEESLVALAAARRTGGRPPAGPAGGAAPAGVAGLYTRGGPPAPAAGRVADLDALPPPARDLVQEVYDAQRYYALLVADRNLDCLLTSRGCPFACAFCYNPDRRMRFRAVDACLDELQRLADRGVRTVEILDANFAASPERAIELLDGVARARLGLRLRVKARADAITRRFVTAARRAGVYQISIGMESGAPRILAAMGKRVTVTELAASAAAVMGQGINCHTSWIIGYPGETRETIAETVALVRRMKPTTAGFAVLIPYPGTAVYEEARVNGTLVGDWSPDGGAVPWVRLPWTPSYADLLAARRAVLRRVYWRPHYLIAYGRAVLGGANWMLARYAAQELWRSLPGRRPPPGGGPC